jgi:hypothetical protein
MHSNSKREPSLLPFILAASLLHALLLVQIHAPAPFHPKPADSLDITFETASARTTPTKSRPVSATPPRSVPRTGSVAPPHADAQTGMVDIDPQQLQRSIGDIARDEGVRSERSLKSREEKQADTPLARLQQAMRQPHRETRMQDGIIKIVTPTGTEVCYRPAPNFAREAAALYAIPTTCP